MQRAAQWMRSGFSLPSCLYVVLEQPIFLHSAVQGLEGQCPSSYDDLIVERPPDSSDTKADVVPTDCVLCRVYKQL